MGGSGSVAHAAGVGAHPAASALASAAEGGSPAAPGTTAPVVDAEPGSAVSAPAWHVGEAAPAPTAQPLEPVLSPPDAAASSEAVPQPTPTAVVGSEAGAASQRPRFLATVSVGASVDADSSAAGKTAVSPAFAGELGFGDGPTGVDIRLFSSQASGRAAASAPDRLALDVMLALRPWATRTLRDLSWGARALRTVTVNLGLSGERTSAGSQSALRPGLVTGVRVDLPLGAPSGEAGELRLRLAFRRLFAGEVTLGDSKSRDSNELLTGLCVVF